MLTSFKGFDFYPLGSAKLTDNTSSLMVSDIDNSSLSGFGVFTNGELNMDVQCEPFDMEEGDVLNTHVQIKDGFDRIKTVMEASVSKSEETGYLGLYTNGRLIHGQLFLEGYLNGVKTTEWEIPVEFSTDSNWILVVLLVVVVVFSVVDYSRETTQNSNGTTTVVTKVSVGNAGSGQTPPVSGKAPKNVKIIQGADTFSCDHIYIRTIEFYEGSINPSLVGNAHSFMVTTKGKNKITISDVIV